MLGFGALGQFAIAELSSDEAAAVISPAVSYWKASLTLTAAGYTAALGDVLTGTGHTQGASDDMTGRTYKFSLDDDLTTQGA